MKRKLILGIATMFYKLSKFMRQFDRTPYFMHTSIKYKCIRFISSNALKLSNKITDLA